MQVADIKAGFGNLAAHEVHGNRTLVNAPDIFRKKKSGLRQIPQNMSLTTAQFDQFISGV